jgi:glyoxylase-like metal-dependent hydrolase (beta-lactamase superfamily II)
MRIGQFEILPVIDGRIASKLPASKPLPDPKSVFWQQQHGMFRTDGLIESTVGGFLVRAGHRVILIDAGAGQPFSRGYTPPKIDPDDPNDPIAGAWRDRGLPDELIRQFARDFAQIEVEQGRLPSSLAAIGVRPDEITDVILTHLHFDHIGWVSTDGTPFFPQATIHCAAADLDYFLPGAAEEFTVSRVYCALTAPQRLDPVLDRIQTWDSDRTLFSGIDVRLAPGHTPGSSVVVISDGPEMAMLLGDVIHCPLELMDEDFDLLADHDPVMAQRVREALARELEGSQVAVAAAHFPGLRFGRLLPGNDVRNWTFTTA